MDNKQCFTCKEYKDLDLFFVDRRKYQVKADKGRCKVCIECEKKKALKHMEILKFSFEENKFVTIKFDKVCDVINYFK